MFVNKTETPITLADLLDQRIANKEIDLTYTVVSPKRLRIEGNLVIPSHTFVRFPKEVQVTGDVQLNSNYIGLDTLEVGGSLSIYQDATDVVLPSNYIANEVDIYSGFYSSYCVAFNNLLSKNACGVTNRTIYVVPNRTGKFHTEPLTERDITCIAGCFSGTLEEFKEAVDEDKRYSMFTGWIYKRKMSSLVRQLLKQENDPKNFVKI